MSTAMGFVRLLMAMVLIAGTIVCAGAQGTSAKEAQAEGKGIPPRVSPADYQFQAQTGSVTIAAEFTGHSLPTLEGPLTTEDYVAVETALFGAAGERLHISAGQFSLRLDGKRTLPSQPYGLIVQSLRDPEWIPPDAPATKSKTSSIGTGGQQAGSNDPPAPVKIPIALQRAMAQRVQRAALPEGDRPLPQAGLIFFRYRGKTENLHAMELVYDGPAGKAVVNLRP